MGYGKATGQQIRDHNRRLLLRVVYDGVAMNRAALAQATGLAKPTVSDLVAELIAEGLLEEGGRGESTDSGGKRPRLLRFVPEARQVIGVSLDESRALAVLCNLDGKVIAEHHIDLEDETGDDALIILKEAANGLVAQLDAPLLCLGVGVPGIVSSSGGIVRQSAPLGWRDVPLARLLNDAYNVPVHIGNSTELAALAQHTFVANDGGHNLVILQIGRHLEMGAVLGRGAYHFGRDISSLRVTDSRWADSALGISSLQTILGWASVGQRAGDLKTRPLLVNGKPTYLDIRRRVADGDPAMRALCNELAHHLALLFAWVIGLLRPDHLSLAGPMADLGRSFLDEAARQTQQFLPPETLQEVNFSLADSTNLSARGAVARTIEMELGIW